MYSVFTDRSINKLFYKIIDASVDWPRGVERRGGRLTIDSPGPVCVCLTDPRNIVLTIPGRVSCFPATCAETLWVLGGRNDLGLIKYFLPRAADFSDDGVRWRAGYGPRLRGSHIRVPVLPPDMVSEGANIKPSRIMAAPPRYADFYGGIDQVKFVVDELTANPTSRRAVITLLDPKEDSIFPIDTKDFPCTQSLSFMMRDGKLDLTVFIRSNDLIWGWSHINVFEFCVLQELVSNVTKIPLGQFYIISNSLHIYEDLAKKVATISSKERFDVYDYCEARTTPKIFSLEEVDSEIKISLALLDKVRRIPSKHIRGEYIRPDCEILNDLLLVSLLYTFTNDIQSIFNVLPSVTDAAFKVALLEYLTRTTGKHPEVMAFVKIYPEPVARYILQEL